MAGTRAILSVLIIAIIHSSAEGRILTECQAVRELQHAGISRTFISHWVCLMKSESGLDTRRLTGPKTMSSYSYGILQINSRLYCARGHVGGLCNKRCEDFLDDYVQDDIACAQIILNYHGFKTWNGWMKRCKYGPLPNIGICRRRREVTLE